MNRRLFAACAAVFLFASCSEQSDSEKFLTDNAARESVQVTDSGLQYEMVREGSGRKPTLANEVTVHYEGKLIDGTVFDSSYERGEPMTFPLAAVVPGWKEGLQLMSVGSEYNLYVPSELGYGERASGPIPANSALVFRVELLDVR